MRLAIASGKGGTGKTTVAVNLALYLKESGHRVCLADCDVEEPNVHYFLDVEWAHRQIQTVPVPAIDSNKCIGESCLQCVSECRFKSLIWMADTVMVFPELCHGCGLCLYLCPADAVKESTREIGFVRRGNCHGLNICGGLLRIGEAMAPPLISRVLEAAHTEGILIADAPPGTSCPVVQTVSNADYVILVAEPTPFGLHDFRITVELLEKLGLAFGVAINRDGMGDDRLEKFILRENIHVLARFPYSMKAAMACSRGELLIRSMPGFNELYRELWDNLQHGLQLKEH